jgi:hypothetical protein
VQTWVAVQADRTSITFHGDIKYWEYKNIVSKNCTFDTEKICAYHSFKKS